MYDNLLLNSFCPTAHKVDKEADGAVPALGSAFNTFLRKMRCEFRKYWQDRERERNAKRPSMRAEMDKGFEKDQNEPCWDVSGPTRPNGRQAGTFAIAPLPAQSTQPHERSTENSLHTVSWTSPSMAARRMVAIDSSKSSRRSECCLGE